MICASPLRPLKRLGYKVEMLTDHKYGVDDAGDQIQCRAEARRTWFVGLNTRRLHSALVVDCESCLQIDATESNLLGRPTALIEA
jgi:hypothetical protein